MILTATARPRQPQQRAQAEAHGLLADAAGDEAAARAALVSVAWWLLAAAAFRGACTMVQKYQGEAVGHHLAFELRLAYYARLQRLSFRYHDRTHTGELMTRGILDIEGMRAYRQYKSSIR